MINRTCLGWLMCAVFGAVIPLTSTCTFAATLPTLSQADRRIGFVDYVAHDVVIIPTALGVVTRIILADDEKIIRPPDSGFPGSCDDPLNEWCIRADVGHNQITIKPRKGATQNNLEVSTDKREYSFALHAMPGAEKSKTVFFRVVFRYPMPTPPLAHVRLPSADSAQGESTSDASIAINRDSTTSTLPVSVPTTAKRQELARPVVRNVNYSVKAQGQAQSILPTVIFDDGRFTYMKFPKSREVPAVFAMDGSGQEVRVAFHSDRLLVDPHAPDAGVESDYLVIRRIARSFALRLGELVAEIINDRFDEDGIETHNGTTTPTLKREVKP